MSPRDFFTKSRLLLIHVACIPDALINGTGAMMPLRPALFKSTCRVFRQNRSVGFPEKSYPLKDAVLSCETEVLSGETMLHRKRPRVFTEKNK